MPSTDTLFSRSFSRLWQPRRGLFWLALAFNALSSGCAWALHLMQPAGAWLVIITVLALGNALMGWWLVSILWRTSGAAIPGDSQHVQSPDGQQER